MTLPDTEPPALYRRAAEGFVPSQLAGGPWSAEHQHGGPPCGLLARAAERRAVELAGDAQPLQPVRHTVDLFRPVPLSPLRVDTTVLRAGRRLALIESTLRSGQTLLAKSTTVFLQPRTPSVSHAPRAHLVGAPAQIPNPRDRETVPMVPGEWADRLPPGFHFAVEVRWVAARPPTAFLRLPMALVAGEDPSPFQRVAVVADLGNAVSAGRRREQGMPHFAFINVDATLHLVRLPAGEWIALRSSTVAGDQGLGFAHLDLYDTHGWLGSVTQASLAQPAPARPAPDTRS